jgi:hypothetical protein
MSATSSSKGAGAKSRQWVVAAVVVLLLGLVATEAFCRFGLKLGDPPLFMTDPEIGYLNNPGQTCHRFGNLIHFNAYSMRSDDFPAHKAGTNELRIMIIGDSVIYGGVRTDQSLLGTSLLQRELAEKLGRPVVVGNISCNGWGPLNEWPYVRRNGLFDADIFIMELRSGSVRMPFRTDVVGVDPGFPDHKPWSAAGELVSRYLPKFFPSLFQKPSDEGYHPGVDDPQVLAQNLAAVSNMVASARAAGATPYIILHWIKPELTADAKAAGGRPEGFDEIGRLARQTGVAVWDMHDAESNDVARAYRDAYHLNEAGQRDFANVIEEHLAPASPAAKR